MRTRAIITVHFIIATEIINTCCHMKFINLFTAQRYASAVCAVAMCVSVSHIPALYRDYWKDRADFSHGGFRPLILPCVLIKFACPQNKIIFLWRFVPHSRLCKLRHSKSIWYCQQLVPTVVQPLTRVWLTARRRRAVRLM